MLHNQLPKCLTTGQWSSLDWNDRVLLSMLWLIDVVLRIYFI